MSSSQSVRTPYYSNKRAGESSSSSQMPVLWRNKTYRCLRLRPTIPEAAIDFSHEPVIILVGSWQKLEEILFNGKVLCHYSGHFNRFYENTDSVCEIGSQIVKRFNMFGSILATIYSLRSWLTTGKVNDLSLSHDVTLRNPADQFQYLVQCYLLGDFLQVPAFLDHVIDNLEKVVRHYKITIEDVNWIYIDLIFTYGIALREFVAIQCVKIRMDVAEAVEELRQISKHQGKSQGIGLFHTAMHRMTDILKGKSKSYNSRDMRCWFHEHI